jgi:hypothetical protein
LRGVLRDVVRAEVLREVDRPEVERFEEVRLLLLLAFVVAMVTLS